MKREKREKKNRFIDGELKTLWQFLYVFFSLSMTRTMPIYQLKPSIICFPEKKFFERMRWHSKMSKIFPQWTWTCVRFIACAIDSAEGNFAKLNGFSFIYIGFSHFRQFSNEIYSLVDSWHTLWNLAYQQQTATCLNFFLKKKVRHKERKKIFPS